MRSVDYRFESARPPDEVEDVPPPDLTVVKAPVQKKRVTGDPMLKPFQRAAEINRTLVESNADRVPGGFIRVISVTDNSITLRRVWPRPLAIGVRGLTLEVDAVTGVVARLGPMGAPLPRTSRPALVTADLP